MARIYQAFVLDEARQSKRDKEEQEKKKQDKDAPGIIPRRGKELIKRLKERRYNVLFSISSHGSVGSVSTVVIVGAEAEEHHNITTDFYKIMRELGLWFNVGDWYCEENLTEG